MREISVEEAKRIAKSKNLKPVRLKGTEILNFIADPVDRYEEISWQELETLVKRYNGKINEDNGWLKII